jgi:hypothetical protein
MEKPTTGAEDFRFDRMISCKAAGALTGPCVGSARNKPLLASRQRPVAGQKQNRRALPSSAESRSSVPSIGSGRECRMLAKTRYPRAQPQRVRVTGFDVGVLPLMGVVALAWILW